MAVIKGIDFAAVFTDIKTVLTNAFAAVGDSWYFGYVNTNGNAVVYQSDDLGENWSVHQDYGPWDFVAVTATFDTQSLVVTVTGQSYNQTLVYKDDSLVMELDGVVATNGAVCYYPYLCLMQANWTNASIAYPQSGGTTPGITGSVPLRGVVGYTSDGDGVCVIGPDDYDVGPGWSNLSAPYIYDAFGYHLQDPNDPHSPEVLTATRTRISDYNWVGLNSRTLSGYVNFYDFAGFGTGGITAFIVPDSRTQYTRGTYFDGFDGMRSTVIADRGFNGPHQTVTGANIDGTLCAMWVDSNGLIGTVINDLTGAGATDSAGTSTPFGKGKIYGNQPTITWDSRSFAASTQTTSFTGFLLGKSSTAQSTAPYTLYRVHDPDVLNRPHASNTELYSQTTSITQATSSTPDPFATNPNSNAVGTVSFTSAGPSFGIPFLMEACTNTSLVPNPNNSPGCSPVLRELLVESGVAFSVTREMANDGDPNGHQGGNALDLAGPSSPTVLTGTSVSDEAYQEMAEICSFLRQIPALFATVIHYDPVTPQASLFIWDGKIVTASQFGGTSAQIVKDAMSNIHISSSTARLLKGFQDPKVIAALGLSSAYTDPTTGQTTDNALTDPFTSDRYVYVNGDGYVGSDTTGLAAEKQPSYVVNFW